MLKAVLLDLDQTLIDFMNMKRASTEAAIAAMIAAGIQVDKEKAKQILFSIYDEFGIEYNQIFQEVLKRINKEIDYRALASAIVAYRRAQSGMLEPYPSVIPTLIRLKERGMKLAIVSDAPRLKAWLRLAEMKIGDFFDAVIAFEDTNELKPSPKPFRAALQKLGVRPDECIMVGDNPGSDILGAKNSGIRTVFAKYGGNIVLGKYSKQNLDNSGADYEISSIEELLPIVDGLRSQV